MLLVASCEHVGLGEKNMFGKPLVLRGCVACPCDGPGLCASRITPGRCECSVNTNDPSRPSSMMLINIYVVVINIYIYIYQLNLINLLYYYIIYINLLWLRVVPPSPPHCLRVIGAWWSRLRSASSAEEGRWCALAKFDVLLLEWGKLRLVWDWQHLAWTGSRIWDERWITTTDKEHSDDRDHQRQTFWNVMVRNKQVPKSIFVHV